MISVTRICSIEGCEKKSKTKNLCSMHYARLLRKGDALWQPKKRPKSCTVDNCENEYYTKGYCRKHYAAQLLPSHAKSCSIVDCDSWAMKKGWCNTHYLRWYLHGDTSFLLQAKERHGMAGSPLYSVWSTMKSRCINSSDPNYNSYGGRGIKVCKRWINSFAAFHKDMGEKPTPKHSIDRINNDGGYEPSNCWWATKSEQTRNTRLRSDNTSGHKGVRFNGMRRHWTVSINVNKRTIYVDSYQSKEEAIAARRIAELKYWDKVTQ